MTRRILWVFGMMGMKKLIPGILTVIGLLLLQSSILFADEEKKSLEELLVEKGVITKDDLKSVRQVKLAPWIDSISFSGDLRLREEYVNFDNANVCIAPATSCGPDYNRERFRLRFGTEITIGKFLVGFRLASGTGQQVSANQTFTNLFSQKPIFIDRAYLRWNAADWISLTGGKMSLPFLWLPTTEIVWDDDIAPEGLAENLKLKPTDNLVIFINLGQFVLNQVNADKNYPWMFGEQVGTELALGDATKLTLAVADYYPTNIKKATLLGGTAVQQDGNSRVSAANSTLTSQFNVVDVTAQLATKVGPLPIAVMADLIRNTAKTTSGKNAGIQGGVILGKAAAAKTWEVAYFYKYSETDDTLADLADSDFGNGGTNRKGHITWAAYNFTKYLTAKAKFFSTKVVNETLAPGKDSIDKLQLDMIIKF